MTPESSRRLELAGYGAAALLLVALCLTVLAPFLTTLFMGALLAALTEPTHRWAKKKLGNGPAAAAVVFGTFVLVLVPLGLVMLGAAAQGRQLAQTLGDDDALTLDGITRTAGRLPGIELLGGPEKLRAQVGAMARSAGKLASDAILKVASAIPGALLVTVITLVAFFFFLKDGSRLIKWASKRVPLDADTRQAAWNAISITSVRTVWATLAAATAQAAIVLVGYFTLGIPMAWLAGAATWLFAWIPFLGIVPAWLIGLIYLVASAAGPKVAIWFVIGGIGGVIDNVVRAWVLKGGGKLHPLVTVVMIFGAVKLVGVPGVFIGPTLAAVTIALLDAFPRVRSYPQAKSEGTDTRPGEPEPHLERGAAPSAGTA